jgi:hypothetical protein
MTGRAGWALRTRLVVADFGSRTGLAHAARLSVLYRVTTAERVETGAADVETTGASV